MNDDLMDRLEVIGGDLRRRAHKLGQSNDKQDSALIMEGLAAVIEAVCSLCETARKVDGPEGLGRGGEE
ncbi:MAG: hypothetical protein EOP21_00285 [Hyphomicrobiales bacterium]|nr:MAG: hypothetical protein EOP21_00285 [Hyphomicrobiales bacterium]